MDSNKTKSDIAVEDIMTYLKEEGYKPQKVTTDKSSGDCLGCDIIAEIDGKRTKIEVKGSGREKGIPDCYGGEFDNNKKFKADILFVVRLNENNKPIRRQKLTKEEIDRFSESHSEKRMIRISSTLKKELFNENIGKTINL